MTAAKTLIKSVFLKTMPGSVVRAAKRMNYARQLDRVTTATEPEMAVIAQLIEPGDRVVDAGANFGVYTRLLSSLVGKAGTVYSFEPIPETYQLLSSNHAHLGEARVETFRVALSDAPGTVRMEVPTREWGAGAFYRSHVVAEGAASENPVVEVECRTLDQVVLPQGRVAFIKIDVEGHELACVRGARGLLERDRPSLFVEVSDPPDDPDSPARLLFELFASLGYAPWVYADDKVHPRRPNENAVNYFFLQPSHVENLKSRNLVSTSL